MLVPTKLITIIFDYLRLLVVPTKKLHDMTYFKRIIEIETSLDIIDAKYLDI